jgi:hypothetical protein
MDWTFWLAGAVIVGLVIASQVFLHESRWSRRRRDEDETGIDATGSGPTGSGPTATPPPADGSSDDDERSR